MKGTVTIELDDYNSIQKELYETRFENEKLQDELYVSNTFIERYLRRLSVVHSHYFEFDDKTNKFRIKEYYHREVSEWGINESQLNFILDTLLQEKNKGDEDE